MRISFSIIFLLVTCFILTSCSVNEYNTNSNEGRELLGKKDKKNKKDKKDKLSDDEKREKEALEAYEKEQEKKGKDKAKMLKQARKDAEEIINAFSKAKDRDGQIDIFVNLWMNAEGPAIVAALNVFISTTAKGDDDYYIKIVAESMLIADDDGYSNQIAETIASGLTIVEREEDADGLLRVITEAAKMLDKDKKGRGCYYIGQVFADAEYYAVQMGYLYEFYYAFDDEKYLYIMECFLEECTGSAAKCCADEDTVLSGMCECNKKTDVCEYNLFWNQPRVIWLCNGSKCESDRCLCPVIKKMKKSKDKSKKESKKKGKKSSKKPKKVYRKVKKVKKTKKPKKN